MSLKKQISILIIFLFFLLLIGTFSISGFYTRNYLAAQLQSNTQNTATSLGLSLTTVMQQNDKQLMLVMVQAIFDSGHYTKVAIKDMKGNMIIERSRPIQIYEVPHWFIHLVNLNSPTSTARIMSGWNQIGSVEITAHPGYAYIQLWQTLWGLLEWFIFIAILLSVVAIIILRQVLEPLKQIQQQAENICDRNFTVQEKLPTAQELKPVVSAMNQMSLKIKEIIQQQSEEIQHLSKDMFVDSLTALYNRKYLYSILNDLILNKIGFVETSIALIEVAGLEELKQKNGFKAFNKVTNQIALIIKNNIYPETIAARLSNHTFSLLFINQNPDTAIKTMLTSFAVIKDEQQPQGTDLSFNIGVYQFRHAGSVTEIMSAVDNVLKQRQEQNKQYNQLQQPTQLAEIKSASEWLSILDNAINNNLFVLYFQPVKELNTNKIFHYETFLRIKESNKILLAKQFFPYAEIFGKAHLLDKLVLEKIVPIAEAHPELTFAINLSNQSLQQSEFKTWFSTYLQQHSKIAPQLVFETSEIYLVNHLKDASELFNIIKSSHAAYGIDNFGRSFSNFGYLQTISPAYIKFSGIVSEELDNDLNMQFFIKSIIHIAHSLDCKAVACNVESQTQATALTELKVDALQGYLIGNTLPQNEYF